MQKENLRFDSFKEFKDYIIKNIAKILNNNNIFIYPRNIQNIIESSIIHFTMDSKYYHATIYTPLNVVINITYSIHGEWLDVKIRHVADACSGQ